MTELRGETGASGVGKLPHCVMEVSGRSAGAAMAGSNKNGPFLLDRRVQYNCPGFIGPSGVSPNLAGTRKWLWLPWRDWSAGIRAVAAAGAQTGFSGTLSEVRLVQ